MRVSIPFRIPQSIGAVTITAIAVESNKSAERVYEGVYDCCGRPAQVTHEQLINRRSKDVRHCCECGHVSTADSLRGKPKRQNRASKQLSGERGAKQQESSYPADLIRRAVAMMKAGATVKETAKALDVPSSNVSRWRTDYGPGQRQKADRGRTQHFSEYSGR